MAVWTLSAIMGGAGFVAAEAGAAVVKKPKSKDPSIECGMHARRMGERDNPALSGYGVADDAVDTKAAIAACSAALKESPDDLPSRYRLARAYFLSGQYRDAFSLAGEAAKAGYPPAQALLAKLYLLDKQVPRDLDQFAQWSRTAAKNGDGEGENHIGYMYEHGITVEKNHARALEHYKYAGANYFPLGHYNAGRLYLERSGGDEDRSSAEYHFHSAAIRGFDRGWLALGYMDMAAYNDRSLGSELRKMSRHTARTNFGKAADSKSPSVAREGREGLAMVGKAYADEKAAKDILMAGILALGAMAVMSGPADSDPAASLTPSTKPECFYGSDNPYLPFDQRAYLLGMGC